MYTVQAEFNLSEALLPDSVADPGCLSRIPNPTFFHPGSRIRTVSIPDPGSSSKNLSILTQNKAWFRIRIRIRIQIADPDPGGQK